MLALLVYLVIGVRFLRSLLYSFARFLGVICYVWLVDV